MNQSYKLSFHEKLESIQYNAGLVVAGAIRGSSSEKLYQVLGLQSNQSRRWFRRLCQFYKIFKNRSPRYLFEYTKPSPNNIFDTDNLYMV